MKKLRDLNWFAIVCYFLAFEVVYWVNKIEWNKNSDVLKSLLGSSELVNLIGIAVCNVNALSVIVFAYLIGRVGEK